MTHPNFTMDFDTIDDWIESPQRAAAAGEYALYLYELELQRDELTREEVEELQDDERLSRWENERNEGC